MSDVRSFGAVGDGVADDTDAIQHAIDDGDGLIRFPRGTYAISRTLVVDLQKHGRRAISGSGGTAKIVMRGAGPAIRLIGSHTKSADPQGFRPEVWQSERMPTVSAIEIEGAHPEADGIRIERVMQPTLTGVLIRQVRNAVHVVERARNLLIDHCHIYNNTGVGVFLDHVNLHQVVICGNHISYCRLGGVRIQGGEVRNVQITGNDIEYNNGRAHKGIGAPDEPTAEIYIDVEDGTIREGTIASNTLQATHSVGGSNVRIIGRGADEIHKVGMWTICGNLIGNQENNIHLTSARDVTISGNFVYSGFHRNLLVEHSRNVVVGSNCFGHNPDYGDHELCTGLRFVDSVDCNLTGVLVQDSQAGHHTVPKVEPNEKQGLIEIVRCRRFNLSGVQIVDPAPYGIALEDCNDTLITGCTILDSRDVKRMRGAIRWTGSGSGNAITACRLGAGLEDIVVHDNNVKVGENVVDEG